MQQSTHEPLQEAYLSLATLEHRIVELHKLMARMQAHMLNYPTLYVSGQAWKWVEDMFHLIEQAEKLQKEEMTIEYRSDKRETLHF